LEAFHPSHMLPAERELPLPFNISLGRPLSEQPLIHDALLMLTWVAMPLEPAEYGAVLSSPFWVGGMSEWGERAALDMWLRREGWQSLSLRSLPSLLEQGGFFAKCPTLVHMIRRVREVIIDAGKSNGRHSPEQWAERFATWLEKGFGWPGERVISSEEHQAREAWRGVLTELASLRAVSGPMGLREALSRLRQICADTLFQAESQETPIQIMGALEATGESFQALWVLGLSDDIWPPAPRPNPFLPRSMQRELGMPRASADRERRFAEVVTERMLQSAMDVVISYPEMVQDQPMAVSPLVSHLPEQPPRYKPPSRYGGLWALFDPAFKQIVHLTYQPDHKAPVFPAQKAAPGGSTLLADQSHCPFRAYARHRLRAEAPETISNGITPPEHGMLAHQAMKIIWDEWGSKEQLLAMSESSVVEGVTHAVDRTLEALANRQRHRLSEPMLQLERTRLVRLLSRWMVIEAERPDAFEVLHREYDQSINIAGLPLKIRLDRVDRLENGNLLLLDYKTGQCSARDWFGVRPRDPQMMLYLLALPAMPSALAYVQLRSGPRELKGVGFSDPEMDSPLPGVKVYEAHSLQNLEAPNDWLALKEHWQCVLARLANGFLQGDAVVDPLPHACDYCDLGALCRVEETLGRQEIA
ncbi:MAG: PD-(D/E)XK nuclease family protein, partial [Magnetococcales bacterium]|nr:PD-(D/E)XK nuclease family protein [Magnetococcales bacterium]